MRCDTGAIFASKRSPCETSRENSMSSMWTSGTLMWTPTLAAAAAALPPEGGAIRAWDGPARSSFDLPKNDGLRADDGDDIGDHVPARHFVERGQVRETR